jgi:FtsZ-binding cell division protein ZapB
VDQARNFSTWFREACRLLKDACPWAKLGFPGLAVGLLEEDLGWAEACRPAVERADWLGVHCYWQNPDYTYRNHMHDQWGLRFEVFHDLFPDKIIEITEFGNSNGQTPGLPVDQERIAQEYVEYYQKLFEYPYINSAAAFIMSSREGPWEEQGFTWRKESGEFFPVVERVGTMPRPNLVAAVAVPPVVAVAMPPVAPVDERYFPETKRTVKGAFLQAFTRYGLEVCGYPITEQFIEAGVPSQYFERVAMEEYERGKVRLKAVSDEVLRARQMVAQLQREAQSLRQQATASQTAIAQLQREAQSLRQQATASQTTIAQLQREAQGLHQQAVASQTTIAQLQREALELRQQAAVSQETITQLRGQVETLRQQLVAATTTTPTTPPVTTPVVPPPPAIPPAITAPPMEDVTARLRRHPVKRFDRRTLNQIEYLVMQHSVLPGDFPPGKIADYLVEKRQWPGIGYHFYITSDGKIYRCASVLLATLLLRFPLLPS